jgi:LAO/AO transport system kinase
LELLDKSGAHGPAPDSEGLNELFQAFREGSPRALGKVISLAEAARPELQEFFDAVPVPVARPPRVGITGPPGAGKSTLASKLAGAFHEDGERVAILAIDPTSPYTGGALLGDRVRMSERTLESGTFIRSMASRRSTGILARAASDVLEVMERFGFDRLLVETVGAGQSQVEVGEVADSIVVVLVPESGDEVQALKAGLLEAADLLVVNKADRDGSDLLAASLRIRLELAAPRDSHGRPEEGVAVWSPPILLTNALTGEGVESVVDALAHHWSHLSESGGLEHRRRERVTAVVRRLLEEELKDRAGDLLGSELQDGRWINRILAGEESPRTLVNEILREVGLDE